MYFLLFSLRDWGLGLDFFLLLFFGGGGGGYGEESLVVLWDFLLFCFVQLRKIAKVGTE